MIKAAQNLERLQGAKLTELPTFCQLNTSPKTRKRVSISGNLSWV
jgi:hypothetical protein